MLLAAIAIGVPKNAYARAKVMTGGYGFYKYRWSQEVPSADEGVRLKEGKEKSRELQGKK